MTVEDDHGDLPDHAVRLLERLETIRSRFVFGRVGHDQHNKYAERAGLLAEHLNAAMLLSEHRRYAPALVAVRTGLEHHLADRLLFLANRYLQVYPVKKAGVAAEEMRLAALQAGPRPDIARWGMNDGRMNVVVRGLYPTGSLGRGATLSPYYFVGDEYDPFTGRPKNIHRLSTRLDAERQLLHSYSRGNVAELARRPRLTRIAEPSYTDELKPRGR